MTESSVGAGIVSIITESLYDKPIVVFREYIQNSADALDKISSFKNSDESSAQIWLTGDNLFFLDNGTGIDSVSFQRTMTSIADSTKRKAKNIGYKGIGRLSGIPYCSKLSFINIVDYSNCIFQEYDIDCDKYREVQKNDDYHDLDFHSLMALIGEHVKTPDAVSIIDMISTYSELFNNRNTGFLVVLKKITPVLKSVTDDEQFMENLGWLLPVPFLPELLTPSSEDNKNHELFEELTHLPRSNEASAPAKSFNIFYNDDAIYRPLQTHMLRAYLCKSTLGQYAVCVHSFSNRRIEIDRKNAFSGIRIYIDNMLLCDENELIPALQQYGLIKHGTYEVIQAVKGIGAMIYVTDKISISANARRTFIDITDGEAFEFLAIIGEFVESIFKARYALSGYNSAKIKEDINQEQLSTLGQRALQSLEVLARSDITLELEEATEPVDFRSLSKTEQKRIIKNNINKELNSKIKKYLSQTDEHNPTTCFDDFKVWLSAN